MRWALLAIAIASACQPVELGHRRYACDPSGDRTVGSAQCPSGGRCGLEGFCHREGDVSEPWKCAVAADCEGGFQCGVGADGVSRECHDPHKGVDYRCLTSAECSSGWICGLDDSRLRRCHDPAAPRAWPCEATADCVGGWQCGLGELGGKECHDPSAPRAFRCLADPDCLGGWKCGLTDQRTARECHDPAAPRSFACVNDADCLGGWSCGLSSNRVDRECHDPLRPQAWQCTRDSECLGGWRCNLDGLCVDPALEALEAFVAPRIDGGQVLSPLSSAEVEFLSTSFVADAPSTATIAFVRNGQLEAYVVTADSLRRYQLGDAGVVSSLVAQGPKSSAKDPMTAQTWKPSSANYVYVSSPGLPVRWHQLLADGGVESDWVKTWTGTVSMPPAFTQVRTGLSADRSRPPRIVGFSPNDVGAYTLIGGPNEIFTLDPAISSAAGDRLRDMADVFLPDFQNGDVTECTFLVNERGLWVAENYFVPGVSLGDFFPVSDPVFGNTQCFNGRGALKVTGFELAQVDRAVVTAQPVDGGAATVSLWDLNPMYTNRFGYRCSIAASGANPCTTDRIPFNVLVGPCAPCPRGTLVEVVGVEGARGLELQTMCSEADAGTALFYRVGNGCALDPVSGRSSALLANPSPGAHHSQVVGYRAPGGRLWWGGEAGTAISLVLDQVPTAVAARAGVNDVLFFSPGARGALVPELGIASLPQQGTVTGATNWPAWVLSNDSLVDLTLATGGPESGRLLARAQGALAEPRTLVRAVSPAGTSIAVVGAGRQLWSAELPGGAPAPLELRLGLVNEVRSLAIAPARDGGTFAEGYAVAGPTVQRLTATTATTWRADEVVLPRSVTPKAVWYDGARARLGLANGEVLSLPSRVLLAAPVAQGTVDDYLASCRHDFALTSGGVYSLVVRPPLVVGEWERVSLPSGFASSGLAGGRLFAVDRALYVVSRTGDVALLSVDDCP